MPGSRHRSWRLQEGLDDSRSKRRVKQVLMTLLGVALLGLFAWLMMVRPPRVYVARLPIAEMDLHAAPRLAYLREDTLEFARMAEVGVKTDEGAFPLELENLQHSASLQSLPNRLQTFVKKRWGEDILILSITALGVSDGRVVDGKLEGEAYLLCSDFDPTKADTGRFPLRALLKAVSDCPADLKLIVLDAGRLPRDVRLGMPVNEFPRLLTELVVETGDPTLWVLTANSELEKSHIAPRYGQSVFGSYVARGLMGWADLDDDQQVTLEELSSFVAGNVQQFVNNETRSNESQTPHLIWGGGDARGGDRRQMLVPVSRLAMQAERDALEEAKTADLKALPEKQKGTAPKGARRTPRRSLPGYDSLAWVGPMAQAEKSEAQDRKKEQKADPAEKAKAEEKGESEALPQKTPLETIVPAKDEAAETTPAPLTGIDGLKSALARAWGLRDDYLARKERDGWSPVDYAPHLWREFEDLLLGYELLLRSGQGLDANVASNITAEIEESNRRLDDLLHDRKPAVVAHEGAKISISQRLALARPKFIEGVEEPRSFAMAERIAWRPGDPRAADILKLAGDFDAILAGDARLGDDISDKFFKFVRGPAAREPNLVEIRLATQLAPRQSEIDGKLIKKCLETRRMGERVAAQVRPFGTSAGVGENWSPPWIKEQLARGDLLSLSAERTLLTAPLDNVPQAESDLDEARREYESAWRNCVRVREAIHLKNDIIFRIPYYIRWHCAAGLLTGDAKRLAASAPSASDIKQLFPPLQAIIKMQVEPAGVSMGQLEEQMFDLARARDIVEQGLGADIDALLKQPDRDGHIWRMQILLSTPLLSSKVRQQILDAMAIKPPKSDRLNPVTVGLPTGAEPRQPTLADWQQIFLQAELELQTIRLAERLSPGAKLPLAHEFKALHDANQAFTKDPSSKRMVDGLWIAYRNYGASLRDYYAGLPARLKTLQRQDDEANNRESQDPEVRMKRQELLVKVDHQVRFVDCRDAQAAQGLEPAENLRTVNLYELLLFNEARFKAGRLGAEDVDRTYLATSEKAYRDAARSIVKTTPKEDLIPTTQIAFEGESSIKIVDENWQPYTLAMRAEGDSRTNAWVVLQYDPDKLEVRNMPDQYCFHRHSLVGEPDQTRPSPTLVLRNGVSERLRLQVRAKGYSKTPSPLLIRVKADGAHFTHKVDVKLPIPEAVELVVHGRSGTWSQEKKTLILHPFPNNFSDYRFELKNHSGHSRTVKAELLALPASADGKGHEPLPFDADGLPIPGAPELKVLAVAPAMVLPENGSSVPITFPDLPETKDAPKSDPATPVVETRTSIVNGMVLVITDEVHKQRIIKRIDLQPQRPSRYIKSTVGYDLNNGEIVIHLKPKDDESRLPPGGSTVLWDITTDQVLEAAKASPEGSIKAPDFDARLFAKIAPADDRVIKVKLTVDGCPRAFIYHVPTNMESSDIKAEEDLQEIRIVTPTRQPGGRDPAFHSSVTSFPVEFQVDAPVNAFRSPDDVIEVGIDKDRDRHLRNDKPQRFYSDRQVEVLFDKAQSGGRLKLFTKVSDFKIQLTTNRLRNTKFGVLGRSLIGGNEEWSDGDTDVIIDGGPPVVDSVDLKTKPAYVGKPVELVMQVSDQGEAQTGIDFIELAFDLEQSGAFGDVPPLRVRKPQDANRWEAVLPTKDLTGKAFTILVRATDLVGNQSKYKSLPIELVVEPIKESVAKNSDIVGDVFHGKFKIADIKVVLMKEGKEIETTRTDVNGGFTFKEVLPGKYELRATGNAQNKTRSGVLTVIAPSPGRQSIKLE